MKRCRGQLPCEKRANKELRRFSECKLDYSLGENETLDELPKNPDKPISTEQMKRNKQIYF